MAERFYVNCPLGPGPVEVRGPEAHHLAAVCRVRPGDQVSLFNGDGREYRAEVRSVARRSVLVEVLATAAPERELGGSLEVAAPLPKGDRGQFLIEKLTELGVTSFVPLRTLRSVVHPGEARIEKMQRWVIEASKQCGRNVLLQVKPLADWKEYCQQAKLPELRLMAHPSQEDRGKKIEDGCRGSEENRGWKMEGGGDAPSSLFHLLHSGFDPKRGLTIAVGPEGGFADDEVALAQTSGWRVVDLGPRILRVETAALVLAAWAIGLTRS